jgi:hypothetical protein
MDNMPQALNPTRPLSIGPNDSPILLPAQNNSVFCNLKDCVYVHADVLRILQQCTPSSPYEIMIYMQGCLMAAMELLCHCTKLDFDSRSARIAADLCPRLL